MELPVFLSGLEKPGGCGVEEVRLAAGPSHWWHVHLAEGAGTESSLRMG